MTTALFLLRCVELGISMSDLDLLDMGMIYDMFVEKGNDGVDYAEIANQSDFDKF